MPQKSTKDIELRDGDQVTLLDKSRDGKHKFTVHMQEVRDKNGRPVNYMSVTDKDGESILDSIAPKDKQTVSKLSNFKKALNGKGYVSNTSITKPESMKPEVDSAGRTNFWQPIPNSLGYVQYTKDPDVADRYTFESLSRNGKTIAKNNSAEKTLEAKEMDDDLDTMATQDTNKIPEGMKITPEDINKAGKVEKDITQSILQRKHDPAPDILQRKHDPSPDFDGDTKTVAVSDNDRDFDGDPKDFDGDTKTVAVNDNANEPHFYNAEGSQISLDDTAKILQSKHVPKITVMYDNDTKDNEVMDITEGAPEHYQAGQMSGIFSPKNEKALKQFEKAAKNQELPIVDSTSAIAFDKLPDKSNVFANNTNVDLADAQVINNHFSNVRGNVKPRTNTQIKLSALNTKDAELHNNKEPNPVQLNDFSGSINQATVQGSTLNGHNKLNKESEVYFANLDNSEVSSSEVHGGEITDSKLNDSLVWQEPDSVIANSTLNKSDLENRSVADVNLAKAGRDEDYGYSQDDDATFVENSKMTNAQIHSDHHHGTALQNSTLQNTLLANGAVLQNAEISTPTVSRPVVGTSVYLDNTKIKPKRLAVALHMDDPENIQDVPDLDEMNAAQTTFDDKALANMKHSPVIKPNTPSYKAMGKTDHGKYVTKGDDVELGLGDLYGDLEMDEKPLTKGQIKQMAGLTNTKSKADDEPSLG